MNIGMYFQLFGGLGVFIYGMKVMSESLGKAAGGNLKKLLSTMTTNRFTGVLTGFTVTSIIQSSSATTVMIVSFVNAGLLSLIQAIGVIMGANIGTTITAWIVNLTNFKFDIMMAAYIFSFVGIIFMFLKNDTMKLWGGFMVGFALLFIGLHMLKSSVPHRSVLSQSNAILDFFKWLQGMPNYLSLWLFIFVGAVFTIVLQSSSATMAFTITLIGQGYIDFPHGAAMVLGENIGTTITAILASLAGNRMAKKAAIAHTMFNIFGIMWMMFIPLIFTLYIHLCQRMSAIGGVQLAIFHSLFNITNTLIFIWFVQYFEKAINFIFGKTKEKPKYSLLNLTSGLITTPDLAVLEAQKEVKIMASLSYKIFDETNSLFNEEKKKKNKALTKISNLENKIDEYESEISLFVIDLLRENISAKATDTSNKLLEQVRNFEWIGDSCETIAKLYKKAEDNKYDISQFSGDNFSKIRKELIIFFYTVTNNIDKLSDDKIFDKCLQFEDKINSLYKKMKKKTISAMSTKNKKKNYGVQDGLLFMDIIKELEHIGDALKYIIKDNKSSESE